MELRRRRHNFWVGRSARPHGPQWRLHSTGDRAAVPRGATEEVKGEDLNLKFWRQTLNAAIKENEGIWSNLGGGGGKPPLTLK